MMFHFQNNNHTNTMSTYQIQASEVLREYGGTVLKMNEIRILTPDGKIRQGGAASSFFVTNGIDEVKAFSITHSLNEKAVHGNFTTDAFTALTGNVDVYFFAMGRLIASFENINLATFIQPLPPYLAALNAPDADNAWLATI
jgi:hypothetical protein